MKISVARALGTCFGVQDAIDAAMDESFRDNLTIVAQRPVKIVDGSAYVEVASGRTTLGDLEYSAHRIGLRPSSDQLDIGFDFRSPITDNTELHLGVRHSVNYGHISGESSTSGLLRFTWAF